MLEPLAKNWLSRLSFSMLILGGGLLVIARQRSNRGEISQLAAIGLYALAVGCFVLFFLGVKQRHHRGGEGSSQDPPA
jgi:hypothetical protein